MRKRIAPVLVSAGVLIASCGGPSGERSAPTVPSDATRGALAVVQSSPGAESAYPNGVPWTVPGTISFDNYDLGGQGVAYHTPRNTNPGGKYRNDGVGIEADTDKGFGNGFDVGWNGNGNWYRYTVAVAQAARYTVAIRIAAVTPAGGPATFHLEDETGANLTGAVNVPVTGGFQKWTTITTAANLTAGTHVIKVQIDTGNASFNLNTMTYSNGTLPSPSPSPSPSSSPSPFPKPSATPTVPPSGGGLPTTIVNNSGIAGWFYLLGSDANGVPMHLRADGTTVANALTDRGPDGHVDYGVPLAANAPTTFTFPHLNGRLYIALGSKLTLSVNSGANGRVQVSTPVGWNPHDSNYSVLHDWIEYAYSGTTFNVNTTAVDMFGLPLAITLNGSRMQQTGSLPGARTAIFAALHADANFAGTVLSQNGVDLRAVSPGHAAALGLFSPTYLDPYITQVWNYYSTHPYTIAGKPGVSGMVDSTGTLRFTNNGAPYIAFAKPTTLNVFGCNGAIISPNTPAGGLGSDLCAALNRGTALAPTQPDNNPADFYTVPLTNVYSRVIHQYSIAGKAYGFPYDDNGGFSSFIADGQPRSFTITVQQF